MKKEDYFIVELEEQLSDSENMKILKEMKKGVDNRELIILHNLNLVKAVVDTYGSNCNKDELFQYGVLELIDCVDKFDCEKRKSFIKYATKNIKSKINAMIKKLPEYENELNYGNTINIDDNDLINNDLLIDYDADVEANYIKKEIEQEIRLYVNSLPQISRESIKMYYGFYGKQYTFEEIGIIFNVSRDSIKRIIVKELMTIRRLISTKKIDKVISSIQKRK